MGLVSRTYTYSAGAVIVASQHNDNENTLYNLVNGNLSTANLASNAGIVDTQLATISTTGKVNISALTVSSQAQGDVIYASSSSAWARLGPGTSGQFLKTQGAGANPTWADAFVAATQAEQEAASSTTVYTSPGRQHFHPGTAKAWCMFDGTTTGTNAPTAGYGVTSITRNSTGNYTINLSVTFSSANYCVITQGNYDGGSTNREITFATARATTTITVKCYNDGGTLVDTDIISVVAFGDF